MVKRQESKQENNKYKPDKMILIALAEMLKLKLWCGGCHLLLICEQRYIKDLHFKLETISDVYFHVPISSNDSKLLCNQS